MRGRVEQVAQMPRGIDIVVDCVCVWFFSSVCLFVCFVGVCCLLQRLRFVCFVFSF